MKTKRMFALLLATLMLVSMFAVTAFATPDIPYGQYAALIQKNAGQDAGYAYINKCTCSPVKNYLKAGLQVQHQVGNNFYWIPSETTVYYDDGTDTSYVSKTIYAETITYVYGQFKARCGDGALKSYYDSDSN